MMLINLLPYREELRRRRKAVFNGHLALACAIGLVVVMVLWTWLQSRIDAQQRRNDVLRVELKQLDQQIREIATLEAQINTLRQRQAAVEGLQSDRHQPVHLLTELAHLLPDGVHLTSIKQVGLVVTLTGKAQSNERVSQLLRNLRQPGLWLQQPHLLEIVTPNSRPSDPEQASRAATFSMTVQLLSPAGQARSGKAASG